MNNVISERPYPGLRPFKRAESDIFFGREEQTEQLLKKLSDTRFISVVGLSGCGKSSLVRAGMIAALGSGYLASAGAHWRIAAMRPGENPIRHLAEALLADSALGPERSQLQGEEMQADVNTLPFLLAALRRGPLSLIEVLGEIPLPQRTNLLLLVDQFEELFRYHREGGRDATEAFVNLLLASAKQDKVPIYIVTTMRSEYVGDCALFHGLPEVINNGQFLVPRLTREQQEMAVVGPAGIFGGTIEPRLLNRLLNEMGNDPDQLPLLQHCLMRMWMLKILSTTNLTGKETELDEPTFDEITISLEDYETIGGLEKALSNHADEAFEQLDAKQQSLTETLFRCLTERDPDGRDIRHPVSFSEITEVARVAPSEVETVSKVFREPDRCFLTPAADVPLNPDSVLDISHESLIRQWGRLKKWVKQEAESAEIYRELEKDACQWQQKKTDLWRDRKLGNALEWQKNEKPTIEWARRYGTHFNLAMEFLDTSEQEREERRRQEEQAKEEKRRQEERLREIELRRVRQQRKMFAIIGVVLAIALLAVFSLWRETRKARFNAERQTRIAQSRQLVAQVQNVLEKYPQRSLLLAVEALNVTMRKDEPRVSAAEEVLRETLTNTGGLGLGVFEKGIADIVISSDGQWLVLVSKDQTGWLWKLTSDNSTNVPVVLDNGKNIIKAAISPDSHWLITGSEDGTLCRWDLSAADPIADPLALRKHKDKIKVVTFSSDSRWLITSSDDSTIRLWDLETEDPTTHSDNLSGYTGLASRISISPDNHWMITNNSDGTALLWELKENSFDVAPSIRYRYEKPRIRAIAISPDNRRLVTGNFDGTVRLWDLENLNENPIVLQGHKTAIVDIAMSSDNHWLVTSSFDGTARLWDLTVKGQIASDIVSSGDGIKSIAMSPDNHWLITGNGDGTVGIWDLTTSNPIASPIILHGHEGSISHLDITSDNHWLVTSSEDGTARLWDLTDDNQVVTPLILRGHEAGISTTAISHDSHWLLTGSKDATARLWDLTASNPSVTSISLPGNEGDIYTVAISPDSHWGVTGDEDNIVRLWDLTASHPGETSIILYTDENIITVTVSPDSRWLVVGGEKTSVQLWDLTAADPAATSPVLLERDEALYPIAISPNKHWLVAGNEDVTIRLWDLTSDSAATPVDLHKPEKYISAVSFSADSHWLVTASGNDSIRLWDLTKDKPVATSMSLRGHEKKITSVAISPDNRWLVTGGEDATVRLWDWTTDDPTATSVVLRGHKGAVNTIAISPDNRWIATGSEDGTARLWMLQLGELMKIACRTAGRNLSLAEWEKYFPGEEYRQTCSDLPDHWSVIH